MPKTSQIYIYIYSTQQNKSWIELLLFTSRNLETRNTRAKERRHIIFSYSKERESFLAAARGLNIATQINQIYQCIQLKQVIGMFLPVSCSCYSQFSYNYLSANRLLDVVFSMHRLSYTTGSLVHLYTAALLS